MRIYFPVVLACGVTLIAGCSASAGGLQVPRHKVEQKVAAILEAKTGQRPKAVVCPGNLKGQKGVTMRCQLEAEDGSKIGLTVTVTSVKGTDVRFHLQVDKK